MFRKAIAPRKDVLDIAKRDGFNFHTIDGEPYWIEDRFYQFTLNQIEKDLEKPTAELHQMCLSLIDDVIKSDELLDKLLIPVHLRDWISNSWKNREQSLYGRLDFSYSGNGPAKLLEYNAQTPTSIYEAAYFQWNWLANNVDMGQLPKSADQFNLIQDLLIRQMNAMKPAFSDQPLYFSCCKGTDEDKATVDYIRDCANQAGVLSDFTFIEDIGMGMLSGKPVFTDLSDNVIKNIFCLYPFEMMFDDLFGKYMGLTETKFIEPPWKSILSNKGILPLLWSKHKGHPNLLPAYFSGEERSDLTSKFVEKPIFSREGANITITENGQVTDKVDGEYSHCPTIKQMFHPLPKFGDHYTMVGSWLVGDEAAGLTIREDNSLVTKDTALFIPHAIIG